MTTKRGQHQIQRQIQNQDGFNQYDKGRSGGTVCGSIGIGSIGIGSNGIGNSISIGISIGINIR